MAVVAVGSWNLGSRVEVADAEVFAVAKALEAAARSTNTPPDIIIFVDN